MPWALKICRSNPRFVGDPIDVVTGANTDAPVDLVQRGPILFQWVRYYSSARSKTHSSLGWGQSHDFDSFLYRDLDGLRYEDPFGSAIGFQELAIGASAAAGGMLLTRSGEHAFVVAQTGQPSQEFEFSPGSDSARLARLRQGQNTIELRYADSGTLREIIDSRGRLIRVITDHAGRIVQLALADPVTGALGQILLAYEYDIAGNLVRATDVYKTTLTIAYDAANRMTRRTDRRGYSFHFEYDVHGRCIHSYGDDGLLEVFLDYQPDAKTTIVRRGDGGQWIYLYDGNGTITQITDPYGGSTKYNLDDRGRPIQEIDPNGNVTRLHYNGFGLHDYRVDPNGHVLPTRDADPDPPDPLTYRLPETPLEFEFGHLIAADAIKPPQPDDPILALFPPSVVDIVMSRTTAYDRAGACDPVGQSQPESDVADDFGRPVEQTGRRFTERWKYDPNGNLIEHQDRDGSVFRSVYKSWNAVSQEIDPLGNVTSYEQSVQGLVTKVTDPGGTITEYEYDLKDRLIEVRRHGRVRERYRRDKAGNVVEKIDISGRTLVTWEIGPGNLDKLRILASGEKHLFAHDAKGRIIEAATPSGTATFSYNDVGRVLADQRDGKGVVHEFDFGQLVSTTYFGKFKVVYKTYDNGDLIVIDPTGIQHRCKFGKTGLIVKQLGNGVRELCQYDAKGRCRRKATLRTARGNALWMRSYAYSACGDLLAVSDTRQGLTKYSYNAAHRLVEETVPNGPARHFDYDAAGNLVSQPGLTGVVMGQGNRIQEANGDRFMFNDRDHISIRQGPSGTTSYEYNDLDMLICCDLSGEEWTANYDALCRRVNKTWRGQTTTYYWDDFRLAAEVRNDNSARVYIYAHDKALAPFLFVEYPDLEDEPDSGRRYYLLTNQIGVPIRVEDDAGIRCWSAQIDPYGRAHVSQDSTINMPLRFPGHYYDPETGLHYNRFRYYSPELGRYLQSDPLGLEGGINLYAYPSRPLTVVDIDGLGPGKPKVGPKAEASPGKGQGCSSQPGAPPLPTPEEQAKMDQELIVKTRARAKQLDDDDVAGRGPVTCGVIDPRFPNDGPFFGQNKKGQVPKNLSPVLDDRKDERDKVPKESLPEKEKKATPGDHAEVSAADEALKNREKRMGLPPGSANEDDLAELRGHNSNSKETVGPKKTVEEGYKDPELPDNKGKELNNRKPGEPAGQSCPPRCGHCGAITGPTDNGSGMTMLDPNGNVDTR